MEVAMSYKIVVDSCCELPDYCHKDDRYEIVPLTLEVEEEQIIDDESFDQADLLTSMKSDAIQDELYAAGAALDHNLNSAAMNTYSASKIKKNV